MVLQVFNVRRVIAVPLASLQHLESAATYCVHVGASIRQELQGVDLQHAAVVCKPDDQQAKSHSSFDVAKEKQEDNNLQ